MKKVMNEYKVTDVFTPTKPARYTFVERLPVNDKLVAALRTPGKQIVVYGYTGSGKTTLLENKLHQLYESHITSRCITGLKFEQLVLNRNLQDWDTHAAFSFRIIARSATA